MALHLNTYGATKARAQAWTGIMPQVFVHIDGDCYFTLTTDNARALADQLVKAAQSVECHNRAKASEIALLEAQRKARDTLDADAYGSDVLSVTRAVQSNAA